MSRSDPGEEGRTYRESLSPLTPTLSPLGRGSAPSSSQTPAVHSSNAASIQADVQLLHEPRVLVGIRLRLPREVFRRAADRLGRGLQHALAVRVILRGLVHLGIEARDD